MIIYGKGNIFVSKCQTITNTVNTKGVMGAGLALQFKQRYPEYYSYYIDMCKDKKIKIGKLNLYSYSTDRKILSFPTKDHWRDPSELRYIKSGLEYLKNNYKEMGITSLALPPLGCGLGGLNWIDVKQLIEKYLNGIDIEVHVYVPTN